MRLQSDLLELLDLATRGKLDEAELRWDPRHALCVVMAAQGYPDAPKAGAEIRGLGDIGHGDDLKVFHAGTARSGDRVVVSGGRVLGVTALGVDRAAARARAYAGVERIRFEGAQYRTDLGT
jgi:phosphoribosylamine---glycine ligase